MTSNSNCNQNWHLLTIYCVPVGVLSTRHAYYRSSTAGTCYHHDPHISQHHPSSSPNTLMINIPSTHVPMEIVHLWTAFFFFSNFWNRENFKNVVLQDSTGLTAILLGVGLMLQMQERERERKPMQERNAHTHTGKHAQGDGTTDSSLKW